MKSELLKVQCNGLNRISCLLLASVLVQSPLHWAYQHLVY
uniref:Uncharacterized protein n=1 Tax=Arundo donax TaxID=35708 RepID=A0A0A9DMS4_ARUDO